MLVSFFFFLVSLALTGNAEIHCFRNLALKVGAEPRQLPLSREASQSAEETRTRSSLAIRHPDCQSFSPIKTSRRRRRLAYERRQASARHTAGNERGASRGCHGGRCELRTVLLTSSCQEQQIRRCEVCPPAQQRGHHHQRTRGS